MGYFEKTKYLESILIPNTKIMHTTIAGKRIRARSASRKKACYTEKIFHAHTSPNIVGIRKKRLFFGQVMGKICPHQFSSCPGESDRGLGATWVADDKQVL